MMAFWRRRFAVKGMGLGSGVAAMSSTPASKDGGGGEIFRLFAFLSGGAGCRRKDGSGERGWDDAIGSSLSLFCSEDDGDGAEDGGSEECACGAWNAEAGWQGVSSMAEDGWACGSSNAEARASSCFSVAGTYVVLASNSEDRRNEVLTVIRCRQNSGDDTGQDRLKFLLYPFEDLGG